MSNYGDTLKIPVETELRCVVIERRPDEWRAEIWAFGRLMAAGNYPSEELARRWLVALFATLVLGPPHFVRSTGQIIAIGVDP